MTSTEQAASELSLAAVGKKKPHREYDIVVNAEPAAVEDERVTFEQVVEIAFPGPSDPDTAYTITFRGAKGRHHEGELAPRESVTVKKKGTSFDVYPTGKS